MTRQASREIGRRDRHDEQIREEPPARARQAGRRELAIELGEHEQRDEPDEQPEAHLRVRVDEGQLERPRERLADLGVLPQRERQRGERALFRARHLGRRAEPRIVAGQRGDGLLAVLPQEDREHPHLLHGKW